MANIHTSHGTELLSQEATSAALLLLTDILGVSLQNIEDSNERIQQQLATVNEDDNLFPTERRYDSE